MIGNFFSNGWKIFQVRRGGPFRRFGLDGARGGRGPPALSLPPRCSRARREAARPEGREKGGVFHGREDGEKNGENVTIFHNLKSGWNGRLRGAAAGDNLLFSMRAHGMATIPFAIWKCLHQHAPRLLEDNLAIKKPCPPSPPAIKCFS
jgi:hypothetical protein